MKPKKSLGQHFLTSQGAIMRMIEVAGTQKDDTVLEIGPGRGALTEKLLKTGARVIAIEKDRELILFLEKIFGKYIKDGTLTLVEGDILESDLGTFGLKDGKFKLVANIPYNITGRIIRNILGGLVQPSIAVLIVQKEVAERIACLPRRHGAGRSHRCKESLLSIAVNVYGTPRYIQTLKKGSFKPSPKVDSAILSIENISRSFFSDIDEQEFFDLVRTGFRHKRKQLRNNLSVDGSVLEKCGIAPNIRAEDMLLSDWKCLLLET